MVILLMMWFAVIGGRGMKEEREEDASQLRTARVPSEVAWLRLVAGVSG